MNQVIRHARGTGKWFPADGGQLKAIVSECISKADVPVSDRPVVGLISPHAGYVYSGAVAGHSFRAVGDMVKAGNVPETVVVIGFSHSQGFPGVALMDGDMFESPVGQTALDREAVDLLTEGSDRIFVDYTAHDGEHSAENEIPFVQVAAPDAKLVVAIMGDRDMQTIDAFVEVLYRLSQKKKILVVSSTDMLHSPDYQLVTDTDRSTLKKIDEMDYDGLISEWSPYNQVCCGLGPVVTVMKYAEKQGVKRGSVLYYRNSGDDHPESRGNYVVGYGSVVFYSNAD